MTAFGGKGTGGYQNSSKVSILVNVLYTFTILRTFAIWFLETIEKAVVAPKEVLEGILRWGLVLPWGPVL
jgi:hypothetical protein